MARGTLKRAVRKGVDKLSDTATEYIRYQANKVGDRIEERIIGIEGTLLSRFASILLFLIGSVFLLLAIYYFMKDYLGLDDAISYLIVSLVVFIAGIILYNMKGGK